MSFHHEGNATKRWAVTASTALYMLFSAICINAIITHEDSFITVSLLLLLSVFLLAQLSTYLFHKKSISLTYKMPLLNIKHELMRRKSDCSSLAIEDPESYGKLKGIALAINNKLLTDINTSLGLSIINNSPNGFVVVDENDIVIFSNPAFDRLFDKSNLTKSTTLTSIISSHVDINCHKDILCIKGSDQTLSTYQQKASEFSQNGTNYRVIEFQNVDEIVSLRAKLDNRFKVDELTSLSTRFHFNDLIDEVVSNSDTNSSNFLALIDINNFKILNDSAGHDVGDLILMELANIIRSHADDTDIVGRISGDEFAIFFKDKDFSFVENRLINLHKSIKAYRIEHFDTQIGVSVSIGVTKAIGGKDFVGIRGLLQQADLAVMTAKKNGFIFKLYDEKDSDIVFYREAPIWINRIKNAIAHDTFDLFVQEISPFNSEHDLHLEVLLRMKNEQGGYYPPNKFFEVAEKFNLTKQIDEWVVVNSFKKIIDGTMQDCKVSINLSGDTIKDRSAVDRILYYANFYSIDASRVLFEITETMAIDDLNQAISNINTLRISGFSIALDDFGSGFSTFKYIQSIPADYIKIDGIFVKNAIKSSRDKVIVSNIVSIAHELGMWCVAEFVENEDTMQLMRSLGVDYIQGYHVHKPLPASEWSETQESNMIKHSA